MSKLPQPLADHALPLRVFRVRQYLLQDFFLRRGFHRPEIELAALSGDLVGAEKVNPRSIDLEELRVGTGLGENMGVTELAYATDEMRNAVRPDLHVFEEKGPRTFEAAQSAAE